MPAADFVSASLLKHARAAANAVGLDLIRRLPSGIDTEQLREVELPLIIWQAERDYSGGAPDTFKAWLKTVTRRRLIDQLRMMGHDTRSPAYREHRATVSLSELVAGSDDLCVEDTIPAGAADPDAALTMLEYQRARQLIRDRRTQFILDAYYQDQLTSREIGAALGVSESRVNQLRTKALEALRPAMVEA